MNAVTCKCLRELEELKLVKTLPEYQYFRQMINTNTLEEFREVYNKELHRKCLSLLKPATSNLWLKMCRLDSTIGIIQVKGSRWFLDQCFNESLFGSVSS